MDTELEAEKLKNAKQKMVTLVVISDTMIDTQECFLDLILLIPCTADGPEFKRLLRPKRAETP